MQSWMIIALVAAVATVMFFFLRPKQTLATQGPLQVTPIANTLAAAPGVSSATGQVYNQVSLPNPTAAPSRSPLVSAVQSLSPSSVMGHVPVIGGLASGVMSTAGNIGFGLAGKVNSTIGNALGHIPVAGKVLAAPTKIAGAAINVAKKLKFW